MELPVTLLLLSGLVVRELLVASGDSPRRLELALVAVTLAFAVLMSLRVAALLSS